MSLSPPNRSSLFSLGAAVLLDEDGEGRVALQLVGHADHGAVDDVLVREDRLQKKD